VNRDVLKNYIYTQYRIIRNSQNELILSFEKNHHTNLKLKYKNELAIKDIYTIKKSSQGNILMPGIICEGEMLKGEYKIGFHFTFQRIVDIRKERGSSDS